MNNFDRPYFSKSIFEFWRRWHISLSTWFRDYLYIPLGGNRVSLPRWSLNLLVVFLLCGLWHGANWTFVIWGGLHGFYLVFSRVTHPVRETMIQMTGLDKTPKLLGFLKALTTFLLVCFAWIFFRANTLSEAIYIIPHLFTGWENIFNVDGLASALAFGPSKFEWMIGLASVGLAEFLNFVRRQGSIIDSLSNRPILLRWTAYYAMVIGILLLGQFGSKEFIYFQF